MQKFSGVKSDEEAGLMKVQLVAINFLAQFLEQIFLCIGILHRNKSKHTEEYSNTHDIRRK